jgi:hypothetical protein
LRGDLLQDFLALPFDPAQLCVGALRNLEDCVAKNRAPNRWSASTKLGIRLP